MMKKKFENAIKKKYTMKNPVELNKEAKDMNKKLNPI